MKLYVSPASPFARKCRILIREKGLTERIEEVRADPIGGDAALAAVNPLMQVPALVDDEGVAWTDSPLICARLDALAPIPRFIPEGDARWSALRCEVIADGMMEFGVKIRLENTRPETERSQTWIARWRAGMLRGLDAAEANADPAAFDLGAVATVCALTWLDFRFPDLGWARTHPKLAALQATLESRSSFTETKPA
ncbi:MAG: glutathione S-transferase N-terminal domain-containing protein [Hyphomonadaceae bacterium]|nr:glutathione S-transferase N-terminal domain-containing protein [Hyphomonadaceae bacterium]